MTKLAETYLHLKVAGTARHIEETRRYLEYVAAVSALEHFKQEVVLEFLVEEGSIKGWITVGGLIYAGISAYGSFREGIDYMVKDGRAFSEFIIEKVKTEAKLPPSSLYRTERRLGIPGKIQRLYPVLDETDRLIAGGYNTRVHQNLRHVREQLSEIEDALEAPEDKNVLESLLPPRVRERLPKPEPHFPKLITATAPVLQDDRKRKKQAKPRELLDRYAKPPPSPDLR